MNKAKSFMKNYKKTLKLVDQIQKIRFKNNINWMMILKLALKNDPKNTSKILSSIYQDDKKISQIAKNFKKVNKRFFFLKRLTN